jgi:chromosome segregation ATPase
MMYMAIGFLAASLLTIVIIPLVHARAIRLSMRSISATIPQSMAEVQADKDQLRAAFAMSTRRLEITLGDLKTEIANQRAEVGRKTHTINSLKSELSEKAATMISLEMRNNTLNEQRRSAEQELIRTKIFPGDEERIHHAIDAIRSLEHARSTNELKHDRAMRV